MKIAFYLGSFDPFHNGHLKVVKEAFDKFKMDKVVIVPTMQNPWKRNKVRGIYDRGNIIALSIADLYWKEGLNVVVDYTELTLEPPYYSYVTLDALKKKYGKSNSLYFLCGADTIKNVKHWKNGDKIFKEWTFLVVDRPEGDISSSKIKQLIKEHGDISSYVNTKLISLITRYYS